MAKPPAYTKYLIIFTGSMIISVTILGVLRHAGVKIGTSFENAALSIIFSTGAGVIPSLIQENGERARQKEALDKESNEKLEGRLLEMRELIYEVSLISRTHEHDSLIKAISSLDDKINAYEIRMVVLEKLHNLALDEIKKCREESARALQELNRKLKDDI